MSICPVHYYDKQFRGAKGKETLWSFTKSSRKKGTSQVRDNSGNFLLSLPKKTQYVETNRDGSIGMPLIDHLTFFRPDNYSINSEILKEPATM